MTHQEMIDVIQAHADGKQIECGGAGSNGRWVLTHAPDWDFKHYSYRIKQPAALRPHWPAIVRTPRMEYLVTAEVFPEEHPPLMGFVRLATEYPPVMLP